jgi:spore coat protein A, manganese oxidase
MRKKLHFGMLTLSFIVLVLNVQQISAKTKVIKGAGPKLIGDTAACNPSAGNVYKTDKGMSQYTWNVVGGTITSGGELTDSTVTVRWTTSGSNSVSIQYNNGVSMTGPTVMNVSTSTCSAVELDEQYIPQFVDPLPHFAGIRVNAKNGKKLIVKAVPTKQIAVSTGTVLNNRADTVGKTPGVGYGNFWAYTVSSDTGKTWTPPHWPGFTIETQRGKSVDVIYKNELYGQKYSDVNLEVDQTIHWAAPQTMAGVYTGPVPTVPHLHGCECQSESDGGPYGWFTPGYALTGPAWGIDGVDSVYHYPNTQEASTIWLHDHAMGLTRLNVYAGLAAFYIIRGQDEENDKLPGWSGDDMVKEVAPVGTTGVFNPKPYLPEIEIAVQDREFNDRGELYYEPPATNPDEHPIWSPEFFGDIMCVNGKTWPYLSVAPRKYRFHFLDGCNARFLSMWLQNTDTKEFGPDIQIVGSDGGLINTPAVKKASNGDRLFMAPGERYDVVVDFSNVPAGSKWTLMNDAVAPFPSGDSVTVGVNDRIMQFVVSGVMKSAADTSKVGTDLSQVPSKLRATDVIKLANNPTPPVKKRQLTLNEVEGPGGPLEVLVNNSKYDNNAMAGMGDQGMGSPKPFGDITEHPVEGTTELWQIVNLTMDAHPMHWHLVQLQLVSRQDFDTTNYKTNYNKQFMGNNYEPAAGPPMPYDTLNADNAVGGNPAVSSYLEGTIQNPRDEETGWKDVYKCYPGQVTTFLVRFAPTDKALTAAPDSMLYNFDPSKGPGYVWHCHIIDHEDNEMMRPYWVEPSPYRYQSVNLNSTGNVYQVPVGMTDYKWSVSNGGTITSGGGPSDNTVTVTWNKLGKQSVQVNYTSMGTALSVPTFFGVNVVSPSSVKNPADSSIKIYGYNKTVTIISPEGAKQINIYNSGGVVVANTSSTGTFTTIDLSNQPTGTYIVEINRGNNSVVDKVEIK